MARLPLRLVARNLFKHPVRTLLTAGSLAIAVFLLCVLRSLVVTLDAGVRASRSNRLIVQSAVSLFVPLPESYRGKIKSVEGVTGTCGWSWFGGYYQEPRNFFAQFACDQDALLGLYPEIVLIEGSPEAFLAERRAAIVGADVAAKHGWKLGSTVPITSSLYPRSDGRAWEFTIAGIYRSSSPSVDNQTLWFHFAYLRESIDQRQATSPTGSSPEFSIYVVKVKDGFQPEDVAARIDALFEGGPQRVQTTPEAVFQAQFVSMVENIPFFIYSIGSGVFFAVLLAVLNTLLMAAREETHDAGILKALGFDSRAVFLVLLLQGLGLCLAGGGLGVLAAKATESGFIAAIGAFFPYYEVSAETMAIGLGAALAVGLVAGIAPALQLARISPVAALRAEG